VSSLDRSNRKECQETHGQDAHATADVKVRIEMGRGLMWARELASLGPGSMVQLQTLCDQLVDVYAGGKLIARGELVCLDGNFAVRVRELSG
jgi:flagellar motor switch protein FliN/FliY